MDHPASQPSRREFLERSGAALTGVGAVTMSGPAADTNCRRDEAPRGSCIDTAVIGAGIAGLYASFRLSERGQKVHLFEASPRLGGRLYTVPIPGTRIRAELGAMRFTSLHRLLHGLVSQIKLPITEFQFDGTWFYHLRGRRYSQSELAARGPYSFGNTFKLESRSPDDLVAYALLSTLENMRFDVPIQGVQLTRLDKRRQETLRALRLAKNDSAKVAKALKIMTKMDWRFIKRHGQVDGIPLRNTGFWNLLHHWLGNEGFLLVQDGLGYESIVSNWNAAEAVPWFVADFASDQPFVMIRGGFGLLVAELSKLISGKGGKIQTKMRLLEVSRMKPGEEYPWSLRFSGGATVNTKRVIFAMPRIPLERIQVKRGGDEYEGWRRMRQSHLPAVVPRRLFKVLLIFENAWWENLTPIWKGSPGRRVITDMPIRQVYYYSPKWIEDHNPPVNGKLPSWAMVMASYSDEHYVSFWRPFAPKVGRKRTGMCRLPEKNPLTARQTQELKELAENLGVPPRMVAKLRRQLADLHEVPLKQIPEPIFGICMDWGDAPHVEGGWHTWEVNEQGDQIAADMMQPLRGEELYICGEAYSSEQGWIEGALQSTERVLKRLKVPPPKWFQGADFEDYVTF